MFNELKKMKIDIEYAKPVSDEDIMRFEKVLTITFGNQFRQYLKEFGCLRIGYFEFYGISGDNNSIPSAIHATKSKREYIKDFPENLIVFYENGDGVFYCLDEYDNVFECEYNKCKNINILFKNFVLNKVNQIK